MRETRLRDFRAGKKNICRLARPPNLYIFVDTTGSCGWEGRKPPRCVTPASRSCLLWPGSGGLKFGGCCPFFGLSENRVCMCVYLTEVGLSLFVAPRAALKLRGNGEREAHCLHWVYGWLRLRFFVVCVCVYHIYSVCSSMFLVLCNLLVLGWGLSGCLCFI